MPPRKRAATVPETSKAATAPDVPHVKGCDKDPIRMERYSLVRPSGSEARITRCKECGGQLTE